MNLRPNNLSEFEGKTEIKQQLQVYIESAKKQNKVLDHCLIYGLPGTGKTSLAKIIANEMDKNFKVIQGGNILKNTDVINLVLSINNGDIIFIDEIHAVNYACMELLYTIMEDFALDLTIGKEFNSKVTRINVPHFTLIGATTKLGKLPLPFEERFSIVINIREYTHEEICKILIRASAKLQLKISDDEITTIAKNSKNIPRNGIRLIKRVFDFKNCQTKLDINQIMQKLGYFENGLDQNDFNYLLILNKHLAPVGIKTVAHLLNIDQETIEIKIEPYLINHNYIQKTNKGRIITKKGKDFLINNS